MSQQHVEDQKALPRVILAAIFAYFGPRFCLGCATSALLTVINKLVEIAIQKGDDELLRNISEGLHRIETAARTKQPIRDQAMVIGFPERLNS